MRSVTAPISAGGLSLTTSTLILEILDHKSVNATICPSEATRLIFKKGEWQEHMERTRQAARRLYATGKIEILQKGGVVDPSTFKGPIRLRKRVH